MPRKRFRKATQRNRVKRLLREAWRLNKAGLYTLIPDATQLHLFIIYTGPELPSFSEIESATRKAIRLLSENYLSHA